jgi:protein-tyrosine-phosphatase
MYNRFRSQVADAYFKKINKNKNINSYSAGIVAGNPISPNVKKVGEKLGFKITGKPKGIKESLLDSIDLLVIVADNVPESLFKGNARKLMRWSIPDTDQTDMESIERISRVIMKKVDELNKILK